MLKLPSLGLISLNALVLCSITVADAAITYQVDAANQQIIFNGTSALGTPNNSSYTSWMLDELSGPQYNSRQVNPLSGTVTYSEGTTTNSLVYFGAGVGQTPGAGIDLLFQVIFDTSTANAGILTIENLTFSYSTFTAQMKDYINQLSVTQGVFTLRDGSDFGDITYVIPEAAHIGLLLGGVTAALLLLKRRRTLSA